MAVVINTKFLLLMQSYDNKHCLMWYTIAEMGFEMVVKST